VRLNRQYSKFIAGREFDKSIHCRSIFALSDELKAKKLPLVFLILQNGPTGKQLKYRGTIQDFADYSKLVECVKESGRQWVDAREPFFDNHALYWKNDWHFNASGADAAARYIAPKIKEALRKEGFKNFEKMQ